MSFFGRNRAPRSKRSPGPEQQSSGGSLSRQNSSSSQKGGPSGKPLFLCAPFVDAALVKGSFKTIVAQPKYVDIMEWVAVNVFDFYTNLNEFYGVLTEHCTSANCPAMAAGPTLNYLYTQPTDRKQVSLPAPTYIDSVFALVQGLLDNEDMFPTHSGHDFLPTFPATVRHVYRQLLRVFAHLYWSHFEDILHLRAEPHFNSLFAHFLAFGREYQLLDQKDLTPDVAITALWERWKGKGLLVE